MCAGLWQVPVYEICLVWWWSRLRLLKTDRSCRINVSQPRSGGSSPPADGLAPLSKGRSTGWPRAVVLTPLADHAAGVNHIGAIRVRGGSVDILDCFITSLLLPIGFVVLGRYLNCPNYLCVWWTPLLCSLKMVRLNSCRWIWFGHLLWWGWVLAVASVFFF